MVQAGYWLWVAFVVAWNVAAVWTGRARSKATTVQSVVYLAGYVLGFGLLFTQRLGGSPIGFAPFVPVPWLAPLWRDTLPLAALFVAAEAAAFGFAFWARAHLGKLWSGMMTLREGHRVVDTGPYRLVRHPIYTGFIGGAWALALLVASPVALAGALVLTVVMAVKARDEEALLRRELGAVAYDGYAARTPMLVPFAPR